MLPLNLTNYRFRLAISPAQLQNYYRGAVRHVVTYDQQGVRIQFPLEVLRPFVSHGGVQGEFIMRVDEKHKFIDIKRVGA